MAKLSQNMSNLVFRRNIPFKLETYVLNCDMLQVLAEMDGIKNVAAIAADLDKGVEDLVTTLATLYQQKLIFLVKPDPSIVPQSDVKSKKDSYAFNEIDFSESDILPDGGQPKGPSSANQHPTKTPQKSPFTGKYSKGSQSLASHLSSDHNVDFLSKPAVEDHRNSRPNTTVNRNKSTDRENGAGSPREAEYTRTNFKASPRPKSSSRSSKTVRSRNELPAGEQKGMQGDSSTESAVEYFEKGLAYLQRRAYKEALRQFEITLKLDPNNRLCRANIHRIRKLLKNDNKKNLKRIQ